MPERYPHESARTAVALLEEQRYEAFFELDDVKAIISQRLHWLTARDRTGTSKEDWHNELVLDLIAHFPKFRYQVEFFWGAFQTFTVRRTTELAKARWKNHQRESQVVREMGEFRESSASTSSLSEHLEQQIWVCVETYIDSYDPPEHDAIVLWLDGFTYERIGKSLGRSTTWAHDTIKKFIKDAEGWGDDLAISDSP